MNWYVLRYADVLLLYAEALNEWKHGPTTEAYDAINKVRRRGFGNPDDTSICDLPAGLDEAAFREAVRKERAYELAFEGHRRLDLVRWGIYYKTIQETSNKLSNWYSSANYVVAQYTEEGKHELMPIPQREMDLCPNSSKTLNGNQPTDYSLINLQYASYRSILRLSKHFSTKVTFRRYRLTSFSTFLLRGLQRNS